MKSRGHVLKQAICECLNECYKWSQPSIDIDIAKVLDDDEFVPDTESDHLKDRHYLSKENMQIICKHFQDIYHVGGEWDDNIDLLLSYIKDPSSYEANSKKISSITKASAKVIQLIEECKEFFKNDLESDLFDQLMILGITPTDDKEKVEEYWHSRGWVDFKVREFNIFDECYSYNDEDIEVQDYPLEIKIDTWLKKINWNLHRFFHNNFFCGLRIKFNKIKTWSTTKF